MDVPRHERGPAIRIGISSCLLGQAVRFDGGHKRNNYVIDTLGRHFEFVPVCPEVAIGLGTPRQPVRLVGDARRPRVVGTKDPTLDVTAALQDYGRTKAAELHDLSGYILKRGSPSCGMERVKVYSGHGGPPRHGVGVYAREIMEQLPALPVEEEGRLMDPVLRENFIQRVFVYHRWQSLAASGLTAAKLVGFHTNHKFIILAHDERRYRQLGRLVAKAGTEDLNTLAARYLTQLMQALRRRATRKRHSNVLLHLAGYLKQRLDAGDKAELLALIEAYRAGRIPLVVPMTLLKHYLRRLPDRYLGGQHYFDPHPQALMLRNAI